MKSFTRPATVLLSLFSGTAILRLASRTALHAHYGPGFHRAWPLALLGVGLLLAGASLGARVGLYEQGFLAFRQTRLTLLGGLTLGSVLALLGLLATLTAWL
jgi:hypothetical protein